MTSPSKVIKWFFFCGNDRWSPAGQWASASKNYPADRWRLLCWIMLHTFIWARTSHTWTNVFSVVLCIGCAGIVITANTLDNQNVPGAVRGFFILLLTNLVIGGLVVMTSQRTYIAYEHLMRKLILKESEHKMMGIPSTYVTIVSVTLVTLFIRGIHKEIFARKAISKSM